MGYYLYDGEGYVGDLASNQGMDDFAAYIDQYAGEYLKQLVEDGYVPISEELIAEVAAIPEPDDPALRATWENFVVMLDRCSDVAIISDGAE